MKKVKLWKKSCVILNEWNIIVTKIGENGMEDTKIIDLYWERSEEAVRQTEQKYGKYCSSIARHILQDEEDCKECVNDTWLKAWNAMPTERPEILSAFLGAITRNLSLDLYRKKRAIKRGGGEIEYIFEEMMDCPNGKEPISELEEKELIKILNTFLERLPTEKRVIFVRRYWYLDSLAEIAKRCDCSEKRIKSILFRLRGQLKSLLEKEGYTI